MGQHPSKQHSPVTFGYINPNNNEPNTPKKELEMEPETTSSLDQVLAHPELYKLEMVCECNYNSSVIDVSEYMSATKSRACKKCKQQARLSIIQQNLAKELEYIDETYYSGENNYKQRSTSITSSFSSENNNNNNMIINKTNMMYNGQPMSNDDDIDDHVDENWSKITVGDVSSQSTRNTTHNPLDGHSNTSIGAKLAAAQPSSLILDLSGRNLVKLSYGIGYLTNLTKLNLSNNQLTSLPKSIGYLKNLTVLNTSSNQLESLPDTIIHLKKLKALNVSYNKLQQLPTCIGSFPSLIIIMANNNQISYVPHEIANLRKMISFNISNNPLTTLPAGLATIKSLRKLIADECQFTTEFIQEAKHDPPSLLELCARTIVKKQTLKSSLLPDHLYEYLSSYQQCSHCHGPYFESFVTRGRFIERLSRQPIALEYRLCSAHWTDDQDRILNLFSSSSPSPYSYNILPSNEQSNLGELSPSLSTPAASIKKDNSFSSLNTMASTSSSTSTSSSSSSPLTTSFSIMKNRKRSFSHSSSSHHHLTPLPPLPSSTSTKRTPFHTLHSTTISSTTVHSVCV